MTRARCVACWSEPVFVRRFHVVAIAVWLALTLAGCVTRLGASVPWVSFMSGYAIVVSHWGALAGTKAQEAVEAAGAGS